MFERLEAKIDALVEEYESLKLRVEKLEKLEETLEKLKGIQRRRIE